MTVTYVEFGNMDTGLGEGFEDTHKLKPMKYNEAINGPDGEAWKLKNKHNHMENNDVFEEVEKSDLPEGAIAIDSTAPGIARRKS